MIKVNLLPVKKKRKAKPVPGFLVGAILLALATGIVLSYLTYFYGTRLKERQEQVADNERKIAQLKAKIAAVTDYEKRNAMYKQRKEVIEQLSKNKTMPVKIVDEVSRLLPAGVWLKSLGVKGHDINIEGVGFTNTDVVNYVNNCKGSSLLTEVYLQESVQTDISGYAAYTFRLTCKVKI
jgi:type IV pilus assembly protein PilN